MRVHGPIAALIVASLLVSAGAAAQESSRDEDLGNGVLARLWDAGLFDFGQLRGWGTPTGLFTWAGSDHPAMSDGVIGVAAAIGLEGGFVGVAFLNPDDSDSFTLRRPGVKIDCPIRGQSRLRARRNLTIAPGEVAVIYAPVSAIPTREPIVPGTYCRIQPFRLSLWGSVQGGVLIVE